MNDHLSKPINTDELYEVISKYCKDAIVLEKAIVPTKQQHLILDNQYLHNTISSDALIKSYL